jgi:hypothetical protein
MFRTDQASAVLTLPAPAAAGTQGYFTNGNPTIGIGPTILDADFMNMLMMELANVVTAAGLTLSKTNYTQLLTAIRAVGVFITSQSLAAPGYLRLASGFILEWGTATTSATVDVAVVYPLSYPTAQLITIASPTLTTVGGMVGANTPTISGFKINGWTATATRAVLTANYLSIGT